MAHINCVDCLKTYRPHRYDVTFMRVLISGFSDRSEFQDDWVISSRFRRLWSTRSVQSLLIEKTETYRINQSCVADFNLYYQYLNNKRRQAISATFLCFDCEKYYCTNCVRKHSGHLTCSKDDKRNVSEWGRIFRVEMLDKLKVEEDKRVPFMLREHTFLYDVVDMRCVQDAQALTCILDKLEYHKYTDYHRLEYLCDDIDIKDVHVLNNNHKWLATDGDNKSIKIFDVNNNKITRIIKLSSLPHGITEIPSTESSQTLIAVSFPSELQINIVNIKNTPSQVISVIDLQDVCYDLAYCNNKFITLCADHLVGGDDLIHVIHMSGEIINVINLQDLPGIKLEQSYRKCISVHSESETIYVCQAYETSSVVSLSLDGQVLHSVTYTDLKPQLIHVDKDQNVYVMSGMLPIYKLSADLSQRVKIIDENVGNITSITAMRFHSDKFYLASERGCVYIIQYDSSHKMNHGDMSK